MDTNGGQDLDPKHDPDPSSGSRIRVAARDPLASSDHAPHVLILADEPTAAIALSDALVELCCTVTGVARDSTEALSLVRQRRPDLVVMDLRSDADGGALAAARALTTDLALPAVLVSDVAGAPSWKLEPDTRSVTPLTRPLSLEALQSAIEGALLRRALKLRSLERDWYELTFNAVPEAVIVCDADRRVRALNRAAELLTGATGSDALGRNLGELLTALVFDQAEALSAALDDCLATGAGAILRLSARDDSTLPAPSFSCRIAPISRQSDRIGGVLSFSDSTLDHKLEEQLASTDRLDALGALVAGLAHEVNNPLTVSLVNLELASFRVTELARSGRLSSPEAARLASVLREARLGAERIDQLVRELKAYARSEQNASRAVDLRACARWALRFVGSRLEHSAKVTLTLGDAPLVLGNELKLSRVLVHLLVNATQAVQATSGHAEVRLVTRADREGRAVLEVFDTGPPITQELADKIFDPFFSRHPGGPGAGLGLRLSREIVEELGGTLSFESVPSSGTTFRITLPAAEATVEGTFSVDLGERPSRLERGYPALIESSERVAWKLSDVFPKDGRITFELPHLPDDPERVRELASLSEPERLKLNQLRAFAHVNVLGFFVEISVAERLRHAAAETAGDSIRMRALLRFGEEGLKHQRLFSLYAAAFERDFGSPCVAARNLADVANVLLSHSPLAVVLTSLHFTLATQRHYAECVRSRIDGLMESILRHQFLEATQHVELDRLELKRAATGLAELELERALAEYGSMLETVDDLLSHEAALSLQNLVCALDRELSPEERVAVVTSQHRAHRRTFLSSPLEDAWFRDAVTTLLPAGASLLDQALAKLEAAPLNRQG